MIIAVDFDGTLCIPNDYPNIHEPNTQLINRLKQKQQNGDILILWTCRHGETLEEAVEWCKEYGLVFDYVNEDCKEIEDEWKDNRSRKVTANVYIDDKSVKPWEEF